MRKVIVALIALAITTNAAMIQEASFTYATKKSLNECMYELHKLQNQFNGILYFGYLEQNEQALAKEALDNIELYPEEEAEFEKYMNNLKSGYDKSQNETYFLDRAYKKEAELQQKLRECQRLEKGTKK